MQHNDVVVVGFGSDAYTYVYAMSARVLMICQIGHSVESINFGLPSVICCPKTV